MGQVGAADDRHATPRRGGRTDRGPTADDGQQHCRRQPATPCNAHHAPLSHRLHPLTRRLRKTDEFPAIPWTWGAFWVVFGSQLPPKQVLYPLYTPCIPLVFPLYAPCMKLAIATLAIGLLFRASWMLRFKTARREGERPREP
jgi:hypothetical protein